MEMLTIITNLCTQSAHTYVFQCAYVHVIFLSNGCPIMHLFKYMAFMSVSFVPIYVQASVAYQGMYSISL